MNRPERVEINVAEVESAKHLHRLLYDALGFPDYYGANWDAFWDVITEPGRMPHQLVLRGWEGLETKLPREAALMQKCLIDFEQECPEEPCRVEYA